MAAVFASLHKDTNIGHTLISLEPMVTLPQEAFKNLLEKDCLCPLREIIFHLHLEDIDITGYDDETQLLFLTQLASKRFHSTCFTDSNDKSRIRSSLTSPELKMYTSNWKVEDLEDCASRFVHEANYDQIPCHVKLHLACIAKDHELFEVLLREAGYRSTDPKKTKMLFYAISSREIIDVIVKSGVNVNTRDSRGRTPLFYALTSSLDSAKTLLDNGAEVTARDKCSVNVLTFFVEKMLKNHLPADVKGEGIKLLTGRIGQAQRSSSVTKEVINLILCKFVQFLCMRSTLNAQKNHLDPSMLSETLELAKTHTNNGTNNGERDRLIRQLQERMTADDVPVSVVLQTFNELGANPLTRDSDGNTCFHYATQLLFYDVPEETVTGVFHEIMQMKHDARLNVKNHKDETPLLFCLSSKHLIASPEARNLSLRLQPIVEGSELCDTTHKVETAFQLILKICQYAILLEDEKRKRCVFKEMLQILKMFSNDRKKHVAVNNRDIYLNTSLHLWASMAMKSPGLYPEKVYDDYSFRDILEQSLKLLQKCRVQLNDGNDKDEKPLHVCRTWTAVKLLLDAGAKPSATDSSGCTPLLAAAKRNTCIRRDSERFYPDVTQTPNEFWIEVLDKTLDPWTADKNGDSVLGILIQKEAKCLAKALIEVACELKLVQSDTIGVPLLIAVCKDQSSEDHWKLDLVKSLLKSRRSLVASTVKSNNDTALHFSCRNILDLPVTGNVETSLHWRIVNHLLLCGADVNAVGETGESCLVLSDNCPILKDLLSTPVDHSTLSPVLENWKQSSESHAQKLSLVARTVKCRQVRSLYLYPEPLDEGIDSGSFVFPGIDQVGREVAVKRYEKSQIPPEKDPESVLVLSDRCEQIVEYILRVEDGNFHYLAFELMEGDLENYLDRVTGAEDTVKLCKDLLTGLQCLHAQATPVVHGNINPTTVFYHTKPNLCLKIGNYNASSLRRELQWVAPEVSIKDETSFSKESDIFSCGVVLHYLLSSRKHPFAPHDSATKSPEEVLYETNTNTSNGNIVKIDDSLSPEAVDLVHLMLDSDPSERPSAGDALVHPFFWDNETKKKFLHVVGNEPEIAVQETRRPHFSAVQRELEGRFKVIVTGGRAWNASPAYDNMSATYAGMKIKKAYKYKTVAGLIRFIRNAYEHINEQPQRIQEMWENDFVLNYYFPHLVIEVYKALTRSKFHKLHKSSRGIKKFLSQLKRHDSK